ncbi:catalase family protein [Undibacterium sp. 5I1]|uniref:catalase family protein n=1 Tax=unclassified Undibacterium TaxID=2630295 RepID=UPI002AB53F5E|nr:MULTISPECIES: catalase family protein [unclassified Undibacterium]MDY7540393.1 catalase family protein [Undibacterium sp. 5I1]MEB0230025.1 catalase family protein [Undibacterium sp. 10I3]MEB0258045.1 catalase family protein [Undibacterium sp. 5I1]
MSSLIPPVLPLPYKSTYEVSEEEEDETQIGLLKTLKHISEITYKDSGHATRSVHAKSHGLLHGELTVADNLPPELAQGIFAHPGHWPLVIRFSTIPGDLLDDAVSTPRGMAIKLIGVNGERLAGSEDDVTQDFVLVNGSPTFGAPRAKEFLGSLKLLASTTDKAPGLKKVLSAVLQSTEKVLEAVGSKSGKIIAMGGHPETNILGETFFSQVPILFGTYMAKLSVVPVSAGLVALTGAAVDLSDKPNGLREAVVDFFAHNNAEWELRVQLCTDIEKMPIEDASVAWPEELSPYLTVARISVPSQVAWSEGRSKAIDDGMSFSPWHGVVAHRPLGSIMRIRKAAYEMSAKFRAEHNRLVVTEPTSLDDPSL